MIQPDTVTAGIRIVRAEEAWEPVLIGGMIPIAGALAVLLIIWRAVKANPEDDPPADAAPHADGVPPEQEKEGGPEGPPSGAT